MTLCKFNLYFPSNLHLFYLYLASTLPLPVIYLV